jgi:hypothetical protein
MYVFVPYYWMLFTLSFILLFPLVIALGLLGIAIGLVLLSFAMIDYNFIITYRMNYSLNKAILRKLRKKGHVPSEPTKKDQIEQM